MCQCYELGREKQLYFVLEGGKTHTSITQPTIWNVFYVFCHIPISLKTSYMHSAVPQTLHFETQTYGDHYNQLHLQVCILCSAKNGLAEC